ncbi:Fc.00g004050.m01.CDS01 [Cosmosporella sp. VM-42]
MVISSYRTFRFLVVGLLFAFSHVLNAANLKERFDPPGHLGVRLDYELATQKTTRIDANHRWLWSSHLKFKEEVKSITSGQLTKIAIDAYKEMEADFKQYEIQGDEALLPDVMSILAFGTEIILASSQKGAGALIDRFPDSPVRQNLELCKIVWRDYGTGTEQANKNKGKCGEVMTFHQYYRTHPQEPLLDLKDRARATTVRRPKLGTCEPMLSYGSPREVT